MHTRALRYVLVLATLFSGGCATVLDTAVDAAARRTGERIGSAAGERIGAAAVRRMPTTFTPELTMTYVGYLFTMGLHSGSYTVEERAYEPGEWTRWVVTDETETEMERAFLARMEDGREWWRVRYTDRSGEETGEIVLEGLFSADRGELIRLRARMPGETEASELPVQEGGPGYVPPRPLTAQSLEGATVGSAEVRVPAGTFSARHVRYGTGGGTIEWWLSDRVPGGLVRYTTHSIDGESVTVELAGHGTGATSELGVL